MTGLQDMTKLDEEAGAVRHAYGAEGLWGEGLRAGLGLVLGLGLAFVAPAGGAIFAVGTGLVVLFAAYGGGVWLRRRTVIRSDSTGLAAETGLPPGLPFGLGGRRLDWDAVSGVTLRYFSTRRDRSDGWMQLTVRGPGGRIVAQSTISDFPLLARRAGRAALRNRLALGSATRRNLEALGLELPERASW